MTRLTKLLAAAVLCASAALSHAEMSSGVAINGVTLSVSQLRMLEQQVGYHVPAGNYLVNFMNGCWVNLSTGESGCPGANGGAYAGGGYEGGGYEGGGYEGGGYGVEGDVTGDGNVDVFSRYGSGERTADGDWSHYSEYGGAVGGTGDGCYYTAEWSNC